MYNLFIYVFFQIDMWLSIALALLIFHRIKKNSPCQITIIPLSTFFYIITPLLVSTDNQQGDIINRSEPFDQMRNEINGSNYFLLLVEAGWKFENLSFAIRHTTGLFGCYLQFAMSKDSYAITFQTIVWFIIIAVARHTFQSYDPTCLVVKQSQLLTKQPIVMPTPTFTQEKASAFFFMPPPPPPNLWDGIIYSCVMESVVIRTTYYQCSIKGGLN